MRHPEQEPANLCPACGCDLDQPHNEYVGLDGPDQAGPCWCENEAHDAKGDAK